MSNTTEPDTLTAATPEPTDYAPYHLDPAFLTGATDYTEAWVNAPEQQYAMRAYDCGLEYAQRLHKRPMHMSRASMVWLATALRRIAAVREASYRQPVMWSEGEGNGTGLYKVYGGYDKSHDQCEIEVLGPNHPMKPIIACLFTAGYCDMWNFCNTILGPETGTSTKEGEAPPVEC